MDVTNAEEDDIVLYEGAQATVREPYNGVHLTIETEDHDRLRVGPHLLGDPRDENVRAINGVGDSRAEDLSAVRIQTVGELATADDETLAEADFSEELRDQLREKARDRLGMMEMYDDAEA